MQAGNSTRSIVRLCTWLLLGMCLSGCSVRAAKRFSWEWTGFGCPNCGARAASACHCHPDKWRAGYAITAWHDLLPNCPDGNCYLDVSAVEGSAEEVPSEQTEADAAPEPPSAGAPLAQPGLGEQDGPPLIPDRIIPETRPLPPDSEPFPLEPRSEPPGQRPDDNPFPLAPERPPQDDPAPSPLAPAPDEPPTRTPDEPDSQPFPEFDPLNAPTQPPAKAPESEQEDPEPDEFKDLFGPNSGTTEKENTLRFGRVLNTDRHGGDLVDFAAPRADADRIASPGLGSHGMASLRFGPVMKAGYEETPERRMVVP